MKKLLLFAALIAIVASCGKNSNTRTTADNDRTHQDSVRWKTYSKDSLFNEIFNDMSIIAANDDRIADREREISSRTRDRNLSEDDRNRIASNMAAINDMRDQSDKAMDRMKKALKQLEDRNENVTGVRTAVGQYDNQIRNKDQRIASLTSQVRALNIQVAELSRNLGDQVSTNQDLHNAVTNSQTAANAHTVYYIIGEDNDLTARDIIDKKGFLVRTRVVSDETSLQGFTKADDRNLERIPMHGRRVRIVTPHPDNSYTLVMGGDNIADELVITDKEAFWQNSKILVVSYKEARR